jgi:hypothetical protein
LYNGDLVGTYMVVGVMEKADGHGDRLREVEYIFNFASVHFIETRRNPSLIAALMLKVRLADFIPSVQLRQEGERQRGERSKGERLVMTAAPGQKTIRV